MATILHLAQQGGPLVKLDPGLGQGEQEERMIYGAVDLVTWASNVLPGLPADRSTETPQEQLWDCWLRFCLGEVLHYGTHFKHLKHAGDGVWELKTVDVRIFGWFPTRDVFVAVEGDTKIELVRNRSYGQHIRSVMAYRSSLPLDEPKYIAGDDPNAVVSNCCFP